jgi:hypothetical protein
MTSLSKNVQFSIEKISDEGSFVVRSKTKSFNLEHIVDKDIVSFYGELSKYGIVDTGILPLCGTGVLAIRSAGNHTQITFQHAPQISYINWGAHEGDKNARTYLVAQPYRIWIGDTIDGNLFGVRMFYSPHPITSPNQELYHLNLPNTNCRGYRGNGVGWQCLYHKDDWSNLPLNEKIIRFAERCSGVETFNDQNMSETDGPRFYASYYDHDPDYAYLWEPIKWQRKTQSEGLEWALDEKIWVPVLVEGLDKQERHFEGGKPLTLGMALVGDYQAYYHDTHRPKPINALTRSDLFSKVTPDLIASWIMRSHNSARVAYLPSNSMEDSVKHREDVVLDLSKKTKWLGKSAPDVLGGHDQDDDQEQVLVNIQCPISGSPCSTLENDILVDSLNNAYCAPCYAENVVYCENSDSYLPMDSEYVYYHESASEYYDVRSINFAVCPNCQSFRYVDVDQDIKSVVYHDKSGGAVCCDGCAETYFQKYISDYVGKCSHCNSSIAIDENGDIHPDWDHIFVSKINVYLSVSDKIIEQKEGYCSACISSSVQCPTGHLTWFPLPELPIPIELVESGQNVQITHICSSCANPEVWSNAKWTKEQLKSLSTLFSVVTRAEERFIYSLKSGLVNNSNYVKFSDLMSVESKEIDSN